MDTNSGLKEKYWKPGNVLVTVGNDLRPGVFRREYYIVKNDGLAYPCNKKVDKWWHTISEDDYNESLDCTLEGDIKKYWHIVEVYCPICIFSKSDWMSDNVMQTSGDLFYGCLDDGRALELNGNGGFLEKDDYKDDLTLTTYPRSWDIARIYKCELRKDIKL